jgi:sec-independent protein translocase protein TatB
MHFADSIIVFIIALILFGPKKLPEIGRQVGKLLAEFRKASNEFKSQIDEELRVMEQQERQKRLEAATDQAVKQAALTETSESTTQPTIMPPSTGETVSADSPYVPSTPELPATTTTEDVLTTPASSNGHIPEAHTEPENAPAPIHHG